jgi:hypothetical protein
MAQIPSKYNPYPTTQLPNPRANPNKNELKAAKTTKRDLHIAFNPHGDRNENGLPAKTVRAPARSAYSSSINRGLIKTRMASVSNQSQANNVVNSTRPKSLHSPTALFQSQNSNQNSRSWKSSSSSSLNDILPYSTQIQNQHDFPYDDFDPGAGSYSDSEITLTLEEAQNDESVNGLSVRFQQGLVTDARQSKGDSSKNSDFGNMKNVVQEIASQLTPPQQHEIIYTTQPPDQSNNQSQQQYLFEEQYITAPPNDTEYYVDQGPMINSNNINDTQPCNDTFKNERNQGSDTTIPVHFGLKFRLVFVRPLVKN